MEDKFFDIELMDELSGIDKNLNYTMIAANEFINALTIGTYPGMALLDTNGIISRELWEKKKESLIKYDTNHPMLKYANRLVNDLNKSGLKKYSNSLAKAIQRHHEITQEVIETQYGGRK